MPLTRIGLDHRWAAGILTPADLTTAYEIRRFPVQSDMLESSGAPIHRWLPPGEGSTPPLYSAVNEYGDASMRPDGGLEWTWVFSALTFGMYKYIIDTQFGGAYSADATLMDYSEFGLPIFVNAIARRPVNADQLKRMIGGYRDVPFSFVGGIDVTPAP